MATKTKDEILGGGVGIVQPVSPFLSTQVGGGSGTGQANSGDKQPSMTYDELQTFANAPQAPADDLTRPLTEKQVEEFARQPQAPADDISRMRGKDDPDGESDVNDELLSNPPASNDGGTDNGSSLSLKSRTTPPWGDGDFYDWAFKQLEPYKPPTQEEIEAERKKQRRNAIFAAIGDGLSALSNLYFTTQGAPSMDDGKTTLTGKMQERYDKLKSERDANSKFYLNSYLNLMRQKRADETAEQNAQYKKSLIGLRQQDTQMKLKKYQSEIDKLVEQGKTEEARQKYLEAQTLYYQSKAEGQDIANEWAPRLNEGKLNLQGAQTRAANSRAHASDASANNSNAKAEATRQKTANGGSSSGKSSGDGKKTTSSSGGGTQNKSASSGGSYTNTKKLGL